MDEIKVNYQIWKDKFEEIFKTYEVIDSYLRNNDAIHLHLKSLQKDIRIQQNSPNDPYLKTQSILPAIELIAKLVEIDKEKKQLEPLIKKADDMYHEGVQYEKYNFIVEFSSQFVKQIIVMMYSHLYDCLKDYFKYLLKENPKILIGLINTGTEKKGLIPFSKVLEAENLTTIIDEQINVSSAQLVDGGKFTDVFKRIQQFGKIEIQENTQKVIMAGHELRNKIVHEITNTEVVVEPDPKEIKESIQAMLIQLEAGKNDIK